ncbi:unnamed protein product [Litomosoides sigmodontis]|uniref:RanBP2-type domain-containing protein n=1 Tax=Litomosoides sigmodontis TaxID=42156 RepID=A0A3P6TYW0_LITSI|nr:unnamed protein product [Litomosoides sigmodontis]
MDRVKVRKCGPSFAIEEFICGCHVFQFSIVKRFIYNHIMMERKTGGWLSSVVGNISGLWSRPPTESHITSRETTESQNSSRNTSYEEQGESDVGEDDDGFIVETVCAGPSGAIETARRTQSDIAQKQRAVRYLSPTTLLAATRSVSTSADMEKAVTPVSRKRVATSCLFQDDLVQSNVSNTLSTSCLMEASPDLCSTKRSRIQRDFSDEKSFFSLSSLTDARLTGRSKLNQSFASSFTPLKSLTMKPKVSFPSSTSSASSLSSKTRAILEQLEKISSPVKEVKRLSSFNLNEPERWANDAISSPVQKPPRNSACAMSRAQLISNILASKSSSPFWSRPAYSTKTIDNSTAPSRTVQMPEPNRSDAHREPECNNISTTKSTPLLSSKEIDLNSSKKPDREEASMDGNVEKSTVSLKVTSLRLSASASKTADTVLPPQPSSTKSTNVFSARDLGVVSPVKEVVTNDKDKMMSSIKTDGTMFVFAPPMKRGPSSSRREEISAKISGPASSFAETTSKSAAEKTADGFSFPAESVSKQIEGQSNTADREKETQPEVSASVKPADVSTATSDMFSMKQPREKFVEQWSCPKCMIFNKADIEKCVCCDYQNHKAEAKPWTCSECWISNKSTDDKCIACGNAKQSNGKSVKLADIGSQNNTFTSVFGDRTFKPLSTSGGISFGFSAVKPITDGSSLSSAVSPPVTTKTINSSTVVNGNAITEAPLKFGLSSSTLAPSFGFGKAPEINSLPTLTEEQPLVMSSSGPSTSLSFGVSSGSSATTVSSVPSLTHSSFSFPTLTMTTSAAMTTSSTMVTSAPTTLPHSGSSFSIPVSTNVNPFTFGSSNTTTAEEIKTSTASLFTFGPSGPSALFPAVTTAVPAVTTTTPPSFGTALPVFSTPKAPLFGTSGGSVSSPGGGHDVVEMSSPTTSPATPSTAIGSFGMSKQTTPLFSFGATDASSSTSTGTVFGNLQTTVQNPLVTPKTSLFSFGQQQMLAPKPFEPSTSLTSPPSAFNFGATTSNGAAGFVFGSTSPPTNFTFGAQQPLNNAASATFNFTAATPTPAFGNVPGSASTPNFFSVGSTSSTTARKMLKARRMRK